MFLFNFVQFLFQGIIIQCVKVKSKLTLQGIIIQRVKVKSKLVFCDGNEKLKLWLKLQLKLQLVMKIMLKLVS